MTNKYNVSFAPIKTVRTLLSRMPLFSSSVSPNRQSRYRHLISRSFIWMRYNIIIQLWKSVQGKLGANSLFWLHHCIINKFQTYQCPFLCAWYINRWHLIYLNMDNLIILFWIYFARFIYDSICLVFLGV